MVRFPLSRSRGPPGYLRQNAGVNSTSTLKISRRPTSIAAMQIQVCMSVRLAKIMHRPDGSEAWAGVVDGGDDGAER